MRLDPGTAGFIDRQQPPAPAAHGPIKPRYSSERGRYDRQYETSLAEPRLLNPRYRYARGRRRGSARLYSMKRGSYVSGVTSIFVADRYLCRSTERCVFYACGWQHYIAVVLPTNYSQNAPNAPQSVLNFKISWGSIPQTPLHGRFAARQYM